MPPHDGNRPSITSRIAKRAVTSHKRTSQASANLKSCAGTFAADRADHRTPHRSQRGRRIGLQLEGIEADARTEIGAGFVAEDKHCWLSRLAHRRAQVNQRTGSGVIQLAAAQDVLDAVQGATTPSGGRRRSLESASVGRFGLLRLLQRHVLAVALQGHRARLCDEHLNA